MSSALQKISDYLQVHGRGTTAEFKFELGLSETAVAHSLAHLEATGRIVSLQGRGAVPLSGFEPAEDRPPATATCSGTCHCGGPAAGPELTIWVRRQR